MEGRSVGCPGPSASCSPAELLHSLAREPQLWGYLLSPSHRSAKSDGGRQKDQRFGVTQIPSPPSQIPRADVFGD